MATGQCARKREPDDPDARRPQGRPPLNRKRLRGGRASWVIAPEDDARDRNASPSSVPLPAARRHFWKRSWRATGAIPSRARLLGQHGRRPFARGARPCDERRGERRRRPNSWARASPSSTAPARSNSPSRPSRCWPACDLAVVVAEADEKKIPALQLILRKLDDLGVPRILFLNKIDKTDGRRARDAEDAAAGERRAAAAAPDPAAQGRHRRRLRSTSRWSAPTSTANTPKARSPTFPTTTRRARSRRASPCWRRSPTMTTS